MARDTGLVPRLACEVELRRSGCHLRSCGRSLADRSAHQLVYGNLAKEVRVSVDTVRRWIEVLRNLHLGFLIRPWFKNVSRSLRKEPKWFLRDWASIDDADDRAETFVACHLVKAVDGWNDMGFGKFDLGYLRDKEKREVDFVVIRDGKPWFLVEVKHRDTSTPACFKRATSASMSSVSRAMYGGVPSGENESSAIDFPSGVSNSHHLFSYSAVFSRPSSSP